MVLGDGVIPTAVLEEVRAEAPVHARGLDDAGDARIERVVAALGRRVEGRRAQPGRHDERPVVVGAMDVVLDHQSLGPALVARRPEVHVVDADPTVGLVGAKRLAEVAAAGDEEELVRVDESDPAREPAELGHAVRVRRHLPAWMDGPVDERDDALADIRLQGALAVVLAQVVIEEEMLDPRDPVQLDPLCEIVGLVPEDRRHREVVGLVHPRGNRQLRPPLKGGRSCESGPGSGGETPEGDVDLAGGEEPRDALGAR